jgi:hypothetical protein
MDALHILTLSIALIVEGAIAVLACWLIHVLGRNIK